MLCPVICFSCNTRVGGLWHALGRHTSAGGDPRAFFEEHGVARLCCRRMLTASVDLSVMYADHERPEAYSDNVRVERVCTETRVVQCE